MSNEMASDDICDIGQNTGMQIQKLTCSLHTWTCNFYI